MAENFNLIFGSNASQSYTWSDTDYQSGWETVGDTPPLAEQFDSLQRRADTKAKELNDRLTPIESNNTNIFRQPSVAYALKDIRFYAELPAGWYLECTVAGTTDSGDITLPSPVVENATVTDGTVTWKIRKISSADGVPLGTILAYSSNGNLPSGYLLCDGAAVSRTMYPDLFSAIGTTYGAGDGSTTFNLPDYNTAQRFAQGSTVAGTVKEAGLPNIEGNANVIIGYSPTSAGALTLEQFESGNVYQTAGNGIKLKLTLDASQSNSIYGNSDTVQPPALTTRYIIKAFDGQTADSALIDITQYAQELATKANITGSNMVYHRDEITTSGTYTAPVTGLYKITIKGGGAGGSGGTQASTSLGIGGYGGGEGGTTIVFVRMEIGGTATVVVGAGGAGGARNSGSSNIYAGANGGDSSVTVNSTTYTGGGGKNTGEGGNGTIKGAPGGAEVPVPSTSFRGGAGGGAGASGRSYDAAIKGGGGAGGVGAVAAANTTAGLAGGDGFVLFEYMAPA